MPGFKNAWIWSVIALVVSACGSSDTCDRPQEYVYSKSGQKLVLPEGMSAPDPARNQEIPPLAGERKERSDPCSVLPPELVVRRPVAAEVAPGDVEHQAPSPGNDKPLEIGTAFNGGPTATLIAWIEAWKIADIPNYLAFYSEDYRTPGESESRESWLRRRQELLESTGPANLSIREITFEDLALGRIMVRLIQDFHADDMSRSVIKIMELVPEGGGYRIRHEWVVGFL